jgi:3-deoxy-D-manno-octulosonate 8-phosphate phosphatase (KDO 8-P phosphatase)
MDAGTRARGVRLALFDVDGVLTDGRLWYGADGEALKAFHILDGHGLKMLAASGVATGLLSGRDSASIPRSARSWATTCPTCR